VQPHQAYPTKAELIKNTAFGKPHPCHSYTVTPAVEHRLLILLKSDILQDPEAKTFSHSMKNGHIIYQKHRQHKQTNFRALQYYQFGWETQTNVNEKRNHELREACLFYYDFDVAAVQRYAILAINDVALNALQSSKTY
jgi:hypothetical protein